MSNLSIFKSAVDVSSLKNVQKLSKKACARHSLNDMFESSEVLITSLKKRISLLENISCGWHTDYTDFQYFSLLILKADNHCFEFKRNQTIKHDLSVGDIIVFNSHINHRMTFDGKVVSLDVANKDHYIIIDNTERNKEIFNRRMVALSLDYDFMPDLKTILQDITETDMGIRFLSDVG